MRFPERSSGVLLHISSLPSQYGIGDLGPSAYHFASTLSEAKQRYWQMLPVTPTDAGSGYSPYSSPSAYAGNVLFISPELLFNQGFLSKNDLKSAPSFTKGKVDYPQVTAWKSALFQISYAAFQKRRTHNNAEFESFFEANRSWLEDYSLFSALKSHFNGKSWNYWPADLRSKSAHILDIVRVNLHERIEYEIFLQFVFFTQWQELKKRCNALDIQLIGDMPIYVSYDSADVWTNSNLFQLDTSQHPVNVSGVPPDYFSKTGQRWGNPLYDWETMQLDNYSWWHRRLQQTLSMFDLVRIDHFRGLSAYWSIPAKDSTAEKGEWRIGPGAQFLQSIARKFPSLPLIAEDLGTITADVRELLTNFDLPGMKVLQFAFDDDISENAYAPHNVAEHCVLYTGTHDNNTANSWYSKETTAKQKDLLQLYIGSDVTTSNIHRHLLRLALCSRANLVILPMQDICGLGEESRMNTPGVAKGNWTWRLTDEEYADEWAYLLSLTEIFGRT